MFLNNIQSFLAGTLVEIKNIINYYTEIQGRSQIGIGAIAPIFWLAPR